MKRTDILSSDNNDVDQLWLLIGKVHHKRMLIKQRELRPYDVPIRHLRLLAIHKRTWFKGNLTCNSKKS